MSSLLERARELLERCDAPTALAVTRAQLKAFLGEVIPVLEQQNKWAILHAQNVALKAELSQLKSYDEEAKRGIQYTDQAEVPPPRIDFYPEAKSEARERRVMAIAQIAARVYAHGVVSVKGAVDTAYAILAEVEKQEAGK